MPDADRHRPLGGHDVAPGEDPRVPGHERRVDHDGPVRHGEVRDAVEQGQVGLLAEREHEGVRLEVLELAGRLRETGLVELHALHAQVPGVGVRHRREPLDDHALLDGLGHLGVVRRHPVARAPVHDDRLARPEPLGRASGVDRGVPAAVDDHLATEHRRLTLRDVVQQGHGVDDPGRLPRRHVRPLTELRAHRDEDGVEPLGQGRGHVLDPGPELERHPGRDDARDLGVEHVPRQPVGRDAVAHHAAGLRRRVAHDDVVAEASQLVRGGQPGRAGTHHEDATAGRRRRHGQRPALLDGVVAEESFDGVDAHRLVEEAAVAGRLARVVADAAHDGRERVGLHERAPGRLVRAVLRRVEPLLRILHGRARVRTRRGEVHVDRSFEAPGAGVVGQARADVERDSERLLHQSTSSTSPYRAMLRSASAWRRSITSSRRCGENRCLYRPCSLR